MPLRRPYPFVQGSPARMTQDQGLIFAILAATIGLFIWGRWRHDVVALAALLACVLVGLVPDEQAFHGFGHPAGITVASALGLSHGLQGTGGIDALDRKSGVVGK